MFTKWFKYVCCEQLGLDNLKFNVWEVVLEARLDKLGVLVLCHRGNLLISVLTELPHFCLSASKDVLISGVINLSFK